MIKEIDHVGIAVNNLKETLRFFEEVLDLKPVKVGEQGGMRFAFIPVGDGEIELIQPTDPRHSIAKFIKEKGEGIHHISFEVIEINEVLGKLRKKGITLIDEKPRIGVHGVKISFIDPKSSKGILIELCEGAQE
jgi:methylmalonyl-CoA/ethylmalonyl-CoA epimerase